MDKAGAFARRKQGPLLYYAVPAMEEAGVPHLFATRAGGVSEGAYESLNFRMGAGERRENVEENFRRALAALGSTPEELVCTKQVHGDRVDAVTEKDRGRGLLFPSDHGADGLVTMTPGVTLAGFYADCAVLVFCDRASGAVGVCHAGWRGTALDIAGKTVRKMAEHFGSRPADVLAAVGPAICKNCFETDGEVPDAMIRTYGEDARAYIVPSDREGKWRVDLAGLNGLALRRAGVEDRNITFSGLCTACGGEEFWSHRVTKGVRGVHGAFIRCAHKGVKKG